MLHRSTYKSRLLPLMLVLLLQSGIASGEEMGAGPVRALTFIEVTFTARGHAAGVLRQHAYVTRERQASPGRIILMQDISRPERFVVLERETAAVVKAAQTDTHGLIGGLEDDLIAPPDQRLNREFDAADSTPSREVDERANFYVVAHMDITPENRAGVETSLLKFAAVARHSDGNLGFEILQQTDRPNHFSLVSAWLAESLFRAFASSSPARNFRQTIGPSLGSPYDERLLRRVD